MNRLDVAWVEFVVDETCVLLSNSSPSIQGWTAGSWIPPVTLYEASSYRTISRFSYIHRKGSRISIEYESAESRTCSLTKEEVGKCSIESSASGSEMTDSLEPLAQKILVFFQTLKRHLMNLNHSFRRLLMLQKKGSRDRQYNR
jgi:hypothetical protein